ncbi:MAG: hypothetical protein QM766_13085 [Burkholderiaceae bacterium]
MVSRRSLPRLNTQEFNDFLDDVATLLESSSGTDIRGEIEKRVKAARVGLRDAVSDLTEQSSELAERAREGVERGLDFSRDRVSEHPLSSVGVAAVGGLIVGLLLANRR